MSDTEFGSHSLHISTKNIWAIFYYKTFIKSMCRNYELINRIYLQCLTKQIYETDSNRKHMLLEERVADLIDRCLHSNAEAAL